MMSVFPSLSDFVVEGSQRGLEKYLVVWSVLPRVKDWFTGERSLPWQVDG
jgi:hypothetical protein